jgi:hypothetical protein
MDSTCSFPGKANM